MATKTRQASGSSDPASRRQVSPKKSAATRSKKADSTSDAIAPRKRMSATVARKTTQKARAAQTEKTEQRNPKKAGPAPRKKASAGRGTPTKLAAPSRSAVSPEIALSQFLGLGSMTSLQKRYMLDSLFAISKPMVKLVESEPGGIPAISPEELSQLLAKALPARPPRSRMAEFVGPQFYSTNGVAAVLAPAGSKDPITKQAVEQRRNNRNLLALRTSDGRWIYPTWQFVDHHVMKGLPQLLSVFERYPEWSVAVWLTTAGKELGGRRPVDCLGTEEERNQVINVARQTAARWAA